MMRYIILLLILSSCYNQKKATVQHGRAVATFPEIGADYCVRTYPPKDSLIKGETIVTFDTIYSGGETIFDTVTLKGDTIRIIKTIQFPGTHTIQREVRVDTVEKESTRLLAALDLANIEKAKAIQLATDERAERLEWQAKAKKRFWIIIGMGGLIGLWLFFFIRKRVKK